MHNKAIGDFAPHNSASFLGRFDEPRSKLRHGASLPSCNPERYPPKYLSTRSFPLCSDSLSLLWNRAPVKTLASFCRNKTRSRDIHRSFLYRDLEHEPCE